MVATRNIDENAAAKSALKSSLGINLNKSKNLFNKNTAIYGGYISISDGEVLTHDSFMYSEFIPILPNTSYVKNNNYTMAFYDSEKVFIPGSGSSSTVKLSPANAAYLRVSATPASVDNLQLEAGTESTDYSRYYEYINSLNINQYIFNEQFDSAQKTQGVIKSKNLFNKNAAIEGAYISLSTGEIVAGVNWYYSEYIPVYQKTSYVKKGTFGFAFYNASKVFISGGQGKLMSAPTNAAFVRIGTYLTTLNDEQIEIGTVSTEYAPFGYNLQNSFIPKYEGSKLLVNLPSKVWALVGQELNIYFENIVNNKSSLYDFDVESEVGEQFEKYYRFTPIESGSYLSRIRVYQNGYLLAVKEFTIIAVSDSVGNSVIKNVLIIGDSTTDNPYLIPKLQENFTGDVMSINTIGTRGTSPNNHEGYSGLQSGDLFKSGVPFWNGTDFDFTYYMTNSGIAVPDYVFINLGTNDMYATFSDADMTAKITLIISRYNTMIASIKAYNPAIKIGICLTIPPSFSQDGFGKDYNTYVDRNRFRKNVFNLVKSLLTTYDSRTAELIYVVPINLNLDTENNFPVESVQVNARNTTMVTKQNNAVHPDISGYWQIADSYWYFLKSFET